MNQNELKTATLMADLVLAINQDNLELTKQTVQMINDLNILDDTFSYHSVFQPYQISNKSAIYAVQNLNDIPRREELLWNYQIQYLLKHGKMQEKVDFINEVLTQGVKQLELFQIAQIFEICISAQRYDLLAQVREAFDNASNAI